MVKAIWNDTLIAESNETIVVEGNHYFPPQSVDMDYFEASDSHTRCPWKGTASYYNVVVDDKINLDAAWYYPDPSKAAHLIKGYIAFWRGVKVVESPENNTSPLA